MGVLWDGFGWRQGGEGCGELLLWGGGAGSTACSGSAVPHPLVSQQESWGASARGPAALAASPRSPLLVPSRASPSLAGACIDDTILSRQGVENFAKLPPLEASQGQTLGALALLPSQTCSLLQRGAAHLTALLDRHIQQLRDGAGQGGTPTGPEPPQSPGAP